MNYIRSLVVLFNQRLRRNEINCFRGAIIESDKTEDNILLHGHNDDSYRYSYPLIQYKCIGGLAGIVAVEDGIPIVEKLIQDFPQELTIGKRTDAFCIVESYACSTDVDFTRTPLRYNLTDWIPLSQENYPKYKKLVGKAEKIMFLEQILVGNILSFAKGIGVLMAERVEIKLVDIIEKPNVRLKNCQVSCFDAIFTSNIRLPVCLGLGKGVSKGFGTISK